MLFQIEPWPAPRIIGGYPIVLTNAVPEARAAIARNLEIYGQLPSYRAMLDREGYGGPADLALVGDEATGAQIVFTACSAPAAWPTCTAPRTSSSAATSR